MSRHALQKMDQMQMKKLKKRLAIILPIDSSYMSAIRILCASLKRGHTCRLLSYDNNYMKRLAITP